MAMDVGPLVDEERAVVSRRIFADEAIYQEEMAQIYGHCWLMLGHESQLRQPKDFFASYMGEERVLVTRDNAGALHAFLNTCRHRGMPVCRADKGSAAAFTCTYHAWTYANDGELIGVPRLEDDYFGELDKSAWGLIPVAQLDTYKGLIFATFDPAAPSLSAYLGEAAWYLDCILDRTGEGSELIGDPQKWTMKANWKFFIDNHIGDMYHVPYTHGSPLRVNPRFGQATPPDDRLGFQVRPGLGNGLGVRMEDADRFAETVEPPIGDYLRATQATAMAHLGPVRGDLQLIHGALFPNVGLVPSQFTIRIAHPRGPQTFEVWSYCLFDKGAPPDVRDEVRKRYLRNFGPGGLFEQDDGENWTQCSASTTGFMSRQLGFQHQLGLGHDRHHEDLPGLVGNLRSEMNQRGFYSRWSQHMQAEPGVATVVD